jgi:hypothetical protein
MIMKTAKCIAVALAGLIGVAPLQAEQKPATTSPTKGFVTEPPRQTPVLAEADVVVVGGGLSGIGAAVGAGRAGAKTVLIERTGFLGGWIRGTGLGGRIAVGGWRPSIREGILLDFTKGMVAEGMEGYTSLQAAFKDRGDELFLTTNHEILPQVCQSLVLKAGVQIIYFSTYSGSIVKDGKIEAILCDSPGGRFAVRGKTFIDCTGLASVAAESGSPTKKDLPESELGLSFKITNIDGPRYEAWAKTRPKEGRPQFRAWMEKHIGRPIKLEPNDPRNDGFSWDGWWERNSGELGEVVQKAVEAGDLKLFDRVGDKGMVAIVEGLKIGRSEIAGTFALPRTFVKYVDPSDILQVTEAHIKSTQMVMQYGRFLRKYVPGFEKSQVTRIADMTLNRAGRAIDNAIAPTREEASTTVKNDDAIAVLFRGPGSGEYEVPYRTMVADKLDNLLAVGKSSSGGRAFRTHMLSVIMGQAAGTAAALCVRDKIPVRDVPIRELQAKLRAAGIQIPEKR